MPKFLSLLGPPVLLSLALPLTFFATITTILALTALLFRASVVYFELGVALAGSWLLPTISSTKSKDKHMDPSTSPASGNSRRRSKGSVSGTPGSRTPHRIDSFATLSGTGPSRDFEGLGGWRFADDARDDEIWIGMNSRLELPAASGPSVPPHRRHRRTLSSQSQYFGQSPDTTKRSPVNSRARTPQAYDIGQGPTEYFSAGLSHVTGDVMPMSPEESVAKNRMDERRRSVSAASNASSGSSVQHAIPFTTT